MSCTRSYCSVLLALAVTVAGGLAVSPADAQSLFAGRGLGYAMEPLDGRARGLGGVGLGTPEAALSLLNPASVAGLPAPTIHVTVQPDQFTANYEGTELSASTVRFPLIHIALPYRRFTATLGYASFLDRNWGVERDTILNVGGGLVNVRDRFASHGGVARLRLGSAYSFDQRFALGAAVDVYTGSAQDTVYRIFEADLQPAVQASALNFRGLGYGAGLRWVPSEAVAVEASVSGGGQLEIRSTDVGVPTRTYDLPMTVALGTSGRIAPELLIALSGRWSGWSAVDGAVADAGDARDAWMLGGGIEWDALRIAEQVVPLRLGYRYGALPFRWAGTGPEQGWADERAVTGGFGVRLAGGAALLDAALERGERGGDATGLTESFWRMAFSLTVLGR